MTDAVLQTAGHEDLQAVLFDMDGLQGTSRHVLKYFASG